jgi:hypothetical protein
MKMSDPSMRDRILSSSSPFLTLIGTICSISLVVLIVFFVWLRLRRRSISENQTNEYGNLIEDDLGQDNWVAGPFALIEGLKADIPAVSGSASPPDIELPEGIAVGLQSIGTSREFTVKRPSSQPLKIEWESNSPMNAKRDSLSIESLISSHKRQQDQRERFIFDSHNVGLRHMALRHLMVQQRYEKQIMLVNARSIQVN